MTTIPKRFENNIQLHLMRNLWKVTRETTALIMGIAGPPGEGKSYQCKKVLDSLGYKYITMSTNDFSSDLEGIAAKNLCAKYVEASVMSQITRIPHVLVCDDIDAAIGRFNDRTEYTVNLQHISGVLMHFCDDPNNILVERSRFKGKENILKALGSPDTLEFEAKTIRVPVFFTGNDFTKLYAPLLRAGRMTIFDWIPLPEEKLEIVKSIYTPYLDTTESNKLIEECIKFANEAGVGTNKLTVAFFALVNSSVSDDYILNTIQKYGWKNSSNMFLENDTSLLNFQPTYQNYLEKAKKSIESLINQSYLEG